MSQYNNLSNCINTLRDSVGLVGDSIKVLRETTQDVPRIKNVLLTRRVFGLVPELDLENAKTSFKTQIEPQIDVMINTIDKELERLKRRKTNLQNKHDLQAVRIQSSTKRDSVIDVTLNKITKNNPHVDEQKISRFKFLRNKKERLKYSLSRLNLQEKKSRLSMTPGMTPVLPPPGEER